jgi:hypothetical protein
LKKPHQPPRSSRTLNDDLAKLYSEPSELFHDLVAAAGLDPRVDFRDRDLRGMQFAGANLSGFDFSRSDLRGTAVRASKGFDGRTDLTEARLDPEDRKWFEERFQLLRRLDNLRSEHRDLDAAMGRLTHEPGADRLQLQRLKKRKLMLRDEVGWLEAQLSPID